MTPVDAAHGVALGSRKARADAAARPRRNGHHRQRGAQREWQASRRSRVQVSRDLVAA
jgi:hypothetical protein